MPRGRATARSGDEATFAAVARAGRHDEATTSILVGPLGALGRGAHDRAARDRAGAAAHGQAARDRRQPRPRRTCSRRGAQQALSYLAFFVLLSAGAAFGLYRGQFRRRSYALAAGERGARAARERRAARARPERRRPGPVGLGHPPRPLRPQRHPRRSSSAMRRASSAPTARRGAPCCTATTPPRLLVADRGPLPARHRRLRVRVPRPPQGRPLGLAAEPRQGGRARRVRPPLRMTGTHMDLTRAQGRRGARPSARRRCCVRTGQLANIGGWELDLATMRLEWTEQVFLHPRARSRRRTLRLEETIDFFAPEGRATMLSAIEAAARDGDAVGPRAAVRHRARQQPLGAHARRRGVRGRPAGAPARRLPGHHREEGQRARAAAPQRRAGAPVDDRCADRRSATGACSTRR